MNYEINISERPSCFRKNKKGYYIKFGDEKPGGSNYIESHEYCSYGDASIAIGILHNILDSQKDVEKPSIEIGKFDFFVRAAFYVTDSPNKW